MYTPILQVTRWSLSHVVSQQLWCHSSSVITSNSANHAMALASTLKGFPNVERAVNRQPGSHLEPRRILSQLSFHIDSHSKMNVNEPCLFLNISEPFLKSFRRMQKPAYLSGPRLEIVFCCKSSLCNLGHSLRNLEN